MTMTLENKLDAWTAHARWLAHLENGDDFVGKTAAAAVDASGKDASYFHQYAGGGLLLTLADDILAHVNGGCGPGMRYRDPIQPEVAIELGMLSVRDLVVLGRALASALRSRTG